MKHPIQKIYKRKEDGRECFVPNAIVEWMLNNAYTKSGEKIDMNFLTMLDFDKEDRQQFAQLTGYSLSGFSSLSYVDEATFYAAKNNSTTENYYEKLVKKLKEDLRKPVSELFEIHPDDLE